MPDPSDPHFEPGAEPAFVRWTSAVATAPQPSPAVRAALAAAATSRVGLPSANAGCPSTCGSLTGPGRARVLLGEADLQGLRRPGGSTLVTAHWPAIDRRRPAAVSSWTAGRALQAGTRLAATGLVLGPTLLAPAAAMADGGVAVPAAPAPVVAAVSSAPVPAPAASSAPAAPTASAPPATPTPAVAPPASTVSTAPPTPAPTVVSVAPQVSRQSGQATGPGIAVAVPLHPAPGEAGRHPARSPRHPRLGTHPSAAPTHHRSHALAPSTPVAGSPAPVGAPPAVTPGTQGAPGGLPPAPQVAADLGTPSPLSSAVTNAAFGSLRLPLFLLPIYQAAGDQYGIPWQVLAAINEVETNYGFDDRTSSAGAVGWMQFMPATWQGYGVDATGSHQADPFNPADAIFAAARYLRAAGGQSDVAGAVFAYNHSSDYVNSVMLRAKLIGSFPQAMINALSSLSVGRPPVPLSEAEQASLAVPDAAAGVGTSAAAGAPTSGPRRASSTKPLPIIDALLPGGARARVLAAMVPVPVPPPRAARNSGALAPGGRELHTVRGARVVAVRDGRVVRLGRSRHLGNYVTLADAEGNLFTYSHLSRVGTPPAPGSRSPAAASSSGRTTASAHSVSTAVPLSAGLRLQAFTLPPLRILPPRGQLASTAKTRPSRPGSWRELNGGQVLAAGTVLGQVADTQAVGMLRFSIRPAGDSHSVDPSPYLTAWVLRQKTLDPSGADAAARVVSGHDTTPVASGGSAVAASATPTVSPTAPAASAAGVPGPLLSGAITPAPLASGATASAPPSSSTPSPLPALSPTAAGNAVLRAVTPFAGASAIRTWGGERMFSQSRATLSRTVLRDRRIDIYPCGRADIAAQRIDQRVLAVLEFLADSGLHPSVSALQCGAHPAGAAGSELASGTAVDISAVDGVSITGHQGSGTVTALTVQRLLALPPGFIPHEIISGLSFSQATNTLAPPDHANHIRVSFHDSARAVSPHSPTAHVASALSALSTTLDAHQWKQLTLHLEGLGAPPLLLSGASAARERQPAA